MLPVSGVEECVGEYINPTTQQLEPREWSNTFPNFDHVGSSLLVCFITSTLNGYTGIMMQVCMAVRSSPIIQGF